VAQTAILNGLQSGKNPYRLLVTACECIGILTSNEAFSEAVRANIEAIHGAALQQPEALEIELDDIQARLALAMLTRPELDAEPEDTRHRVKAAIRVHRQRAEEIKKVLHDRADLEERERLVMAELERMESDPEYREKVEAGWLAVQFQGRRY